MVRSSNQARSNKIKLRYRQDADFRRRVIEYNRTRYKRKTIDCTQCKRRMPRIEPIDPSIFICPDCARLND